jgi:multiple sugar transport system permease protein
MISAKQIREKPQTQNRTRANVSQVELVQTLVSVVVALIFLVPLVFMFLAAFKEQKEVFLGAFIPEQWIWQNFVEAWNAAPFGQYFLNSLIVSVIVTISVVLTSSLAAFAFARMKFFGQTVLFLFVLGPLMIPGDVLLIPNFISIRQFGWQNSYTALIVPFLASAFGIFLLRQAYLKTPQELEDASRIDGATPLQFLFRILMPVNAPSLSALSVLTFLGIWNALVWPSIATSKDEFRTVQVGLASFSNLEGSNVPVVLAATTLVILPVLIVYIFAQKWFIESAASSGLKG